MAYDDLAGTMDPEGLHLLCAIARSVFELKQGLVRGLDEPKIPSELSQQVPESQRARWANLVEAIAGNYPDVSLWLKHAIELEVASAGIWRATTALNRFTELLPAALAKPIPTKAQPYIREVVHTYLFGFDAAAIALARGTFEQIARDVLVARGVYTEPQLRRERPTAGALLAKLKQSQLINSTGLAAERLVRRGDSLLHSGMPDGKTLPVLALDSVKELQQVAVELAAQLPDQEI